MKDLPREIVQWHVNVGDMVKLDQIILTVETAKAVVDVPAPYSGKIVIASEEGDVISDGTFYSKSKKKVLLRAIKRNKKTLLPLWVTFQIKL